MTSLCFSSHGCCLVYLVLQCFVEVLKMHICTGKGPTAAAQLAAGVHA